jgi:hypothetical protein
MPVAAVVERLAGALDQPVDLALLDAAQREAVRAAGAGSII